MTSPLFSSPEPIPGANPLLATRRMFTKTFTCSGRASRSEFWWPNVLALGALMACDITARRYDRARNPDSYTSPHNKDAFWPFPDRLAPGEPETQEEQAARKQRFNRAEMTSLAFSAPALVVLGVPTLSLSVRRLHDANLSGHWMWAHAFPFVGSLAAFALSALPSNPKGERFD